MKKSIQSAIISSGIGSLLSIGAGALVKSITDNDKAAIATTIGVAVGTTGAAFHFLNKDEKSSEPATESTQGNEAPQDEDQYLLQMRPVDDLMTHVNGETLRDFCGEFYGVDVVLCALPDCIRKYFETYMHAFPQSAIDSCIEDARIKVVRAFLEDPHTRRPMEAFITRCETVMENTPDMPSVHESITQAEIKAMKKVLGRPGTVEQGVLAEVENFTGIHFTNS